MQSTDWPYRGPDEWVRLTILLGAPLLLAVSAVLAFFPVARGARYLRMGALVLLLVLYGTAVTEHDPGAPLLRGLVLLGLVGAWLWLPRLAPREALGAAGVVAAVGLLSVPVAAAFDADRPWWNYRDWELFGNGQAVTFNWTHTYGPLDWPRNGSTLLNIKSDRAHYWKVETLDGFDGFRWLRTTEQRAQPRAARASARRRVPAGRTLELLRVQQALGLAVPRHGALALERPDRGRGDHLPGGGRRAVSAVGRRHHDPAQRVAARARRLVHRAGLRAGSHGGADARGARGQRGARSSSTPTCCCPPRGESALDPGHRRRVLGPHGGAGATARLGRGPRSGRDRGLLETSRYARTYRLASQDHGGRGPPPTTP